jgi:pimeloyl-ACP methyl ester carboxylesterase
MPKLTSSDGTTIAYDKRGRGPLLLLVLGALNKRGSGKKLADLLADHFTVVSYDRRGRGDSTDTPPYSIDKEVADIEALIDELGGSAYLYGHSSGAVLALLAAANLGPKVTGLALYEVPYNAAAQAARAAESYRKELHGLLTKDQRAEAVALFVKSVGVSDKQIEAMKRLPMWKGLTAMAPTLAYDTIELMQRYPAIDMTAIKVRALVMHGGASPAFMADTAQSLSQALPHAEPRTLDGQSHDVKAEELAPVLTGFFQTS